MATTTENVIQSNKMPDAVDSLNLKPWEGELYQEVLHNSNQDEIDAVSDAFNADKLLDYYTENGQMRKLYQNTGFFVPQAKQGDLTFKEDVTTVGIENGLGLFTQLRVQNFETHDDLANPPTYNTIKNAEYARLVDLNDDGTVTDTQKILMSTKLSYLVGGLLATMGKNQHAGAAETITQMFLKAQGNAEEVLRYLTPDGKSIYNLINEDGLDTSKVNMYFPEGFINVFGQWYLENKELFEAGREIVNPILNVTYDANNPLPIGGFIDNDFVFNYPTDADANTQAWFDDIAANFGSVSAAAATLFNHAFETYKTAYDANANMINRYGALNSTNFYIECKFNLSTFNTVPMIELEMVFIPYTKYRNGDCGIQFDTYDSDYVNSGDIAPNQNQTYSGGKQIPYNSSRLWDTLKIKSNMLDDGTFDVGANMPSLTAGNPGLRVFGMSTQSGEGYKYWFFDNFHVGEGNADFDTDPNATEYDENSGLLSSFINSLSGKSSYKPKGNDNFPNYAMVNPLVGNQNINGSTTVSSQSAQLTTLPTYADLTNTNYPWNGTPTTSIDYVGQQAQQIQDLINNYIANHPSEHSNSSHNDVDISNPSSGGSDGGNTTNMEETIVIDNQSPSSICLAYKLDRNDLNQIAQLMWTDTFFEEFLKCGTGNAISEAIISLNTIYSFCALNAQNTVGLQMFIGGVLTGLTAPALLNRYQEMTICDINTDPLYQSYLDYTAVGYKLFLPGVGYIDLAPHDVLDGINSIGKTIRIKFVIDWYTGFGAYNIYSRTAKGQSVFLGSYQANFGCSIPLTQRNFQSAVQGTLQGFVNGGTAGAAAGGVGATAGAVGGAITGAMLSLAANPHGNITQKGSFSPNGVALGPKKIFLVRVCPNRAYTSEIKRYKNYPDYRACYIANLKGCGLCSFETKNLQGNFSCTNDELNEIKSLLESGVIL